LPPLFPTGGVAVCPRCKGEIVTTGKSDIPPTRFYVDHT